MNARRRRMLGLAGSCLLLRGTGTAQTLGSTEMSLLGHCRQRGSVSGRLILDRWVNSTDTTHSRGKLPAGLRLIALSSEQRLPRCETSGLLPAQIGINSKTLLGW